ncbi:ABC transporter substrate binding protein [Tistrella mobilis]|uniref:ABC transporter substrate-binding protein n=1 Tax=Tistrella mobilis TaxID=171437 RepID=UPI003557A4C2
MTLWKPATLFGRVLLSLLIGLALAGLLIGLLPASTHAAPPSPEIRAAAEAIPAVPGPETPEKRFRIGYYEGGQYGDYKIILAAIVRGLMQLGWVPPIDLPPMDQVKDSAALWQFLITNANGGHVEFVGDAHYTAGDFDPERRKQVRPEIIERLTRRQDIDLMIAMGTWAGQDLANDAVTTPIVVASTSDPVASKIIPSPDDSGRPNLHAKVEPGRYGRQVELFDDIVRAKRLGVVYENTLEGRTFAAIEEVESVSASRGFDLVTCFAPFNGVPEDVAKAEAVRCYQELAPKVDALYITVHRGVTSSSLAAIVDAALDAGVPTFSMAGSGDVRRGVLMSIAQGDFSYVGLFHAEVIGRIFNGAEPWALDQRWVAPAKIALNLETMEIIGFNPPVDILLAADEIYRKIER